MKIIIQDDDGTVLYEQDNPGYIHLPIIVDGKHDLECEDDGCADPRCVERRAEAEVLIKHWHTQNRDLGFIYHFSGSDNLEAFDKLPNGRVPAKVRLASYSRNELVFTNGERVRFEFPSVNVYSNDQVMFETETFNASLSPWRQEFYERMLQRADEMARHEASETLATTPIKNEKLH